MAASYRDNPRRAHLAGIGPIVKNLHPVHPTVSSCRCWCCPTCQPSAKDDVVCGCQGPHDGPSDAFCPTSGSFADSGAASKHVEDVWWCGSALSATRCTRSSTSPTSVRPNSATRAYLPGIAPTRFSSLRLDCCGSCLRTPCFPVSPTPLRHPFPISILIAHARHTILTGGELCLNFFRPRSASGQSSLRATLGLHCIGHR